MKDESQTEDRSDSGRVAVILLDPPDDPYLRNYGRGSIVRRDPSHLSIFENGPSSV